MTEQTESPTVEQNSSTAGNMKTTESTGTSLGDLMKLVLSDSETTPEQKKMLIDELRKNNPGASDRWAFRWSVWLLGGGVIASIVSVTVLAGFCKVDPPEGLLAIATGLVGALAGLLSPGQRSPTENSSQT